MGASAAMKAVLGLVLLLLLWAPAASTRAVSLDALRHFIDSWTGARGAVTGRASKTPPQAGWALYDNACNKFQYAPAGFATPGTNSKCTLQVNIATKCRPKRR